MKLIKNKINSKKIFELHLIKSKTYEQPMKKKTLKGLPNTAICNIIMSFKKSLNIIFKYNKNNKRILFIGNPKVIEDKINNNTIHSSISNYDRTSFNGVITNNSIANSVKLNKYLFKNNKFILSKLKKKPELIVIFKQAQSNHLIKECMISKIPTIEFNCNLKKNNWNYTYNVPGNLNLTENKIIDNIFFIIFNSLLNRSYKQKN
uniref:ribosomal protein S2 n=1 Tax=Nitzschia dissipata TaxID=303402 RepID=UPI0020277BF4|nr:ribosomal protein S2 [Nitzschia dissipata]QYB23046.1 ribosomal protein S2 [Nitzschia dissipata]